MSNEINNEQETNIDETLETPNSTDASQNTEEETADKVDNKIPYARFKEKVDEANALKEKLAEIEKEQAEAKRKELEEQENYKALYEQAMADVEAAKTDRKSTRLNSSHVAISYAVFCLKKKKKNNIDTTTASH